jgi:hypothetical protein
MEVPLFQARLNQFAQLNLNNAPVIDLPQLQEAVRWALQRIAELEATQPVPVSPR